MCACMCVGVCVHIYVYMFGFVSLYVCACMCVFIHAYMHVWNVCAYSGVCICVYMHTYMHMHVYVGACVCRCVGTCTCDYANTVGWNHRSNFSTSLMGNFCLFLKKSPLCLLVCVWGWPGTHYGAKTAFEWFVCLMSAVIPAKNSIFGVERQVLSCRKRLVWEGWHLGTDAIVWYWSSLFGALVSRITISRRWTLVRHWSGRDEDNGVRPHWTHNAWGLHLVGALAWEISMATEDPVSGDGGIISICRANLPENKQLQNKQKTKTVVLFVLCVLY